jgi:hypothetical protein
LRREHLGSSGRAEERTPNVAGDFDGTAGERVPRLEEIEGREIGKTGAAGTDLGPARVGEPAAQRLQQPRATVGASAAAHPHNDAFGARPRCDPDELAGPARCRVERIGWGAPEAPKPGRLSKLDDGFVA